MHLQVCFIGFTSVYSWHQFCGRKVEFLNWRHWVNEGKVCIGKTTKLNTEYCSLTVIGFDSLFSIYIHHTGRWKTFKNMTFWSFSIMNAKCFSHTCLLVTKLLPAWFSFKLFIMTNWSTKQYFTDEETQRLLTLQDNETRSLWRIPKGELWKAITTSTTGRKLPKSDKKES